jgi:osmoprotectant transport system substrate-binding protein
MNTIKKVGRGILAGALSLVLAATIIGCGGSGENGGGEGSSGAPVKIGSKDFTENLIVAEVYALALEKAGVPVERKLNLGSSVVATALEEKEIDLYPEYTGTGLLDILKEKMLTDPDEVYEAVVAGYNEKFSGEITWLGYAPANDGQGVAVSKAASDKYGIKTISDLQKHASNLVFASQGEFEKRDDGLPALEKKYGPFDFKDITNVDNSLKYDLLESGKADVTVAYTTEGKLVQPEFVLLEDDKQLWPPYNIAPVVLSETLKAYPEIGDTLDAISENLTTEVVTALNAKVDIDGEEYADVAKEYYESLGL